MGCFCNLFENSTVWLIIIALILLFFFCGNNDGYPAYNGCNNNGCTGGCGCGCN